MRFFGWLLLAPIILGHLACDDVPTTTSTTSSRLGRTTLADFRAEPSNRVWFEAAFDAYPGGSAEVRSRFEAATADIRANYDSTQHTVLMVVRPDCPCHSSQQQMPAVVKSLLTAGVESMRITVYVTNSRLEGIEEVRSVHQPAITDAPVFIVMRNGVEKGRVAAVPAGGSVEQELARHFASP